MRRTTTTNVDVLSTEVTVMKQQNWPTRSRSSEQTEQILTQLMPGGRIQSLSIFGDDHLHSIIAFRQKRLQALIEVHEKPLGFWQRSQIFLVCSLGNFDTAFHPERGNQ